MKRLSARVILFLVSYFNILTFATCLCMVISIMPINPMIDFKAPISLTELVHHFLMQLDLVVSDLSQRKKSSIDSVVHAYQQVLDINDLNNDHGRLHEMYRNDCQYLQNLIDRLNVLIEALEDNDDKRSLSMMIEHIESIVA